MQDNIAAISVIIEKIKSEIIVPIMWFLLLASFIYFLYGIYEFFSEKDAKSLEKAKKHVLWGLIGLFIIVAASSILRAVSDTVNTVFG